MKFFKLFLRKENLSQNTFLNSQIYIFCYQCENIFSKKKVFLSKRFSSCSQNLSLCSRCNFLLSCQDFALAVKIMSWAGPRSYWPVGWAPSCLGSRTESLHWLSNASQGYPDTLRNKEQWLPGRPERPINVSIFGLKNWFKNYDSLVLCSTQSCT